jgi:hypothetical protein
MFSSRGGSAAAASTRYPASRVRLRGAIRNRRGRPSPLLPPPAVGDNAAMQAEQPKADPPKRKRRWFQFSQRTLLIGVTLLAVVCGYFGCRAKIIRHWTALLNV